MSIPHLRVVEFRPEFVAELVPMWRSSFEAAVGITDPHPIDEQCDYLMTKVVPEYAIRVAQVDDEIVGFIAASSSSVAQLHIRISYQRRGIGTLLLDWAKQRSRGDLWLYTFARNTNACAFYERRGFKPVARGFEPLWQLEDVRYEWSVETGMG